MELLAGGRQYTINLNHSELKTLLSSVFSVHPVEYYVLPALVTIEEALVKILHKTSSEDRGLLYLLGKCQLTAHKLSLTHSAIVSDFVSFLRNGEACGRCIYGKGHRWIIGKGRIWKFIRIGLVFESGREAILRNIL